MSAVWRFFDLGEAICQLCKAEVSGSVKSRREREDEKLFSLKYKSRRIVSLIYGEGDK